VGLKSLEPNYEMWKLACRARNLPLKMQKRIFSNQIANLDSLEPHNNEAKSFLKEYQLFLNRFGYLSMNGTDFSIAPWIENPTIVLKSIEKLGSISSSINKYQVQRARDLARIEVSENLPGFSKLFFNRLLKSTIRYIALRERLSLFMSEDAYQMRRIYLALAELLVNEGVLERRDDIFYLYYGELLSLIKKISLSPSLKRMIRRRKSEIRKDQEIEPAGIICDSHVTVKETKHHIYLDGIVGSIGVARGIARIVRNPEAIERDLNPNDILVVPFIDVGWTPLFPYVGGVVTETGGQLSHSAIIAREYGLPAVLSVKNATYAIKDGQAIIVDGNIGRVYIRSHPK